MNALNFANSEKGVVVTGKTFVVKEILKAHGASWNPHDSAWVFRGKTDVEAVVAEIESAVVREANKVQRVSVAAARAAGARWICCDNCHVIDWARQTTDCSACYPDGHIRVRGCCYTGN